jgi:methyl-accepting chemotaxis protein
MSYHGELWEISIIIRNKNIATGGYMDHSIKRKRINYSIKTNMQMRLFIKVFVISLIGLGIMASIFYFYSDRAINASYRQFHVQADNFLDFLLPAILLSLLATIVLSAAITIFIPIKYAGPLFRIERDLRERVSTGDLTVRFTLRPGDEVTDLADAVNSCLETLGQKITKVRKSAEDLDAAIKDTNGAGASAAKDIIKKINEELKQFKV